MDTLYIVIPAYNEEANIARVLRDWYSVIENYGSEDSRLLVVDDGSKDSTYAILQAFAADHPRTIALTKENAGHGPTVRFAYEKALKAGADYIFQTDSDGQTLPAEFPRFWEDREAYDMVIGHRKGRQDGLSRVIVTRTLKLVLRLIFGVSVADANTPFRLMKAEPLRAQLDRIPAGFNLVNVMLSVLYVKGGSPVEFLPITFLPRAGGTNSIDFRKICKIGVGAVRDFRQMRRTLP